MLSFQLCRIIYTGIFICSYNMKPGCQWSFWTTGFWMALKFFSWNLSHSHKPLINFCCKFVHFNTTKAWSNFSFYQINYQALTNLVPRVLSFSSHSGGRVGEVPGNDEVELWPLLLFQMSGFKCVNLTQSWCFMMSESSVGGNCIRGSYLPSKIIFFTSKSFLNGSRCVSFMFDLFCRIPNIGDLEAICERNDLMTHLMDHPGDWTPVIADWLLHLVTRGLGKRIEMMCYKPQTSYQVAQNTSLPVAIVTFITQYSEFFGDL